MVKKNFRLLVIAFSITMAFTACKKEESAPSAGGGGGGGGTTLTAADYAGTYIITDGCCSGGSFQITIIATSTTAVSITNFRKGTATNGWNLTGTVSNGTLTIPAQNVVSSSQGGPYKFSGTGTLNGNSLSVPYTMADASGNFPQSCSATGTK